MAKKERKVDVKAVEKEGYNKKTAAKIIAAKTREASPAAKKNNPNLKKVLMSDSKNDLIKHEEKEIKESKKEIKADKEMIKKLKS
jgi:hypothetical protein